MRYSYRRKWHWSRVSSEFFCCPLALIFQLLLHVHVPASSEVLDSWPDSTLLYLRPWSLELYPWPWFWIVLEYGISFFLADSLFVFTYLKWPVTNIRNSEIVLFSDQCGERYSLFLSCSLTSAGRVQWIQLQKYEMNLFEDKCVIWHRLCGLVVRVSGCRSRGPVFDSRLYHIFWEVGGLKRGRLSLVTTIEELLEWKSSASGLENRD
jgi:hypothetical protein